MGGESTPAEQPGDATEQPRAIRPATDIQAILTVLGRRNKTMRKQDAASKRWLDLAETDLRGAVLPYAKLERAWLPGAHLEITVLVGAHLQGANLREVHLEDALLFGAHLEGADLEEAHLQGADLGEAHLEGAWLAGAHLEGADLRNALGLTQEQLAKAFGDATTKVADELRPAHWPAATPEEPDNSK